MNKKNIFFSTAVKRKNPPLRLSWMDAYMLHMEGKTAGDQTAADAEQEPSFPSPFRDNLPGYTLFLGKETTQKCQHNAAGLFRVTQQQVERANPHKCRRLTEGMAELY